MNVPTYDHSSSSGFTANENEHPAFRTEQRAGRQRLAAMTATLASVVTLTGYAARFDAVAPIGGAFFERVKPGAFKQAIKDGDVRALFNHDPNFVLGRQSAGTLRLSEDQIGFLNGEWVPALVPNDVCRPRTLQDFAKALRE